MRLPFFRRLILPTMYASLCLSSLTATAPVHQLSLVHAVVKRDDVVESGTGIITNPNLVATPDWNQTASALDTRIASTTLSESATFSPSPDYANFRGNMSDSTARPFLAEVDTISSEVPMREYGPAPYETRYRALDDHTGDFDILKHWGILSPYYSSPLYPALQRHKILPANC
jgi:hypothetical protein